jgi:hypothetical protein
MEVYTQLCMQMCLTFKCTVFIAGSSTYHPSLPSGFFWIFLMFSRPVNSLSFSYMAQWLICQENLQTATQTVVYEIKWWYELQSSLDVDMNSVYN